MLPLWRMTAGLAEISDLIVQIDPASGTRRPVPQQALVARLQAGGDAYAARVVAQLPAPGGLLDPAAVDRLLITVHCEMQRLSEEFQHGQRVWEALAPVLDVLAQTAADRPIRVVDVGCGTGYIIRWLAAYAGAGAAVEWVGADYHTALVAEARRLAGQEGLRCTFQVADAFRLAPPGQIYLSTGVLHHFRGDDLRQFFAQHEHPATRAFLHFDFQPSPFAPLGAWLFHRVRMRQPLARHDGVLSAIRAHPAATLRAAARAGAPGFRVAVAGTHWGPFPRVFHLLLGVRPADHAAVVQASDARARALVAWT